MSAGPSGQNAEPTDIAAEPKLVVAVTVKIEGNIGVFGLLLGGFRMAKLQLAARTELKPNRSSSSPPSTTETDGREGHGQRKKQQRNFPRKRCICAGRIAAGGWKVSRRGGRTKNGRCRCHQSSERSSLADGRIERGARLFYVEQINGNGWEH